VTLRKTTVLLLSAALAFLAHGAAAEKPPRYEFDSSFDFTQLKTFDLRIHESKQREGVMASSVQPKFLALVEELLTAKGYRRDPQQPDFVVMFDTMLAEDWSSTSWAGHAEVAQGLLALRLSQPPDEEPFWMGADRAELTGKITPDKAWKKVDRATRRILAGFPPPPG
jgi:hypothetical protein